MEPDNRTSNEKARDRQISRALQVIKRGQNIHTKEWTDKYGRRRWYDDILLSRFFAALNCSIESIVITKRMFTSVADLLFGGVDTLLATVKVRHKIKDSGLMDFYFYSRTSGTYDERNALNSTTADDLIIRISMNPESDESAPVYFDPTFTTIIIRDELIQPGGERLDYEKIYRNISSARAANDRRIWAARKNTPEREYEDYDVDDIDYCNID